MSALCLHKKQFYFIKIPFSFSFSHCLFNSIVAFFLDWAQLQWTKLLYLLLSVRAIVCFAISHLYVFEWIQLDNKHWQNNNNAFVANQCCCCCCCCAAWPIAPENKSRKGRRRNKFWQSEWVREKRRKKPTNWMKTQKKRVYSKWICYCMFTFFMVLLAFQPIDWA